MNVDHGHCDFCIPSIPVRHGCVRDRVPVWRRATVNIYLFLRVSDGVSFCFWSGSADLRPRAARCHVRVCRGSRQRGDCRFDKAVCSPWFQTNVGLRRAGSDERPCPRMETLQIKPSILSKGLSGTIWVFFLSQLRKLGY